MGSHWSNYSPQCQAGFGPVHKEKRVAISSLEPTRRDSSGIDYGWKRFRDLALKWIPMLFPTRSPSSSGHPVSHRASGGLSVIPSISAKNSPAYAFSNVFSISAHLNEGYGEHYPSRWTIVSLRSRHRIHDIHDNSENFPTLKPNCRGDKSQTACIVSTNLLLMSFTNSSPTTEGLVCRRSAESRLHLLIGVSII